VHLRRRADRASGFTLFELVVTMAIFSILVALGVPSMSTWINNVKVRSVADALQNGLRLAQSESLRRSRQVVFSLTNSSAPQTSLTAATIGSFWSINYVPAMTDGSDTNTFIQSGVLTSTSANVTVTGPAEICFNSIGRLVLNTSTGVAGGSCSPLPTIITPGIPPMFTYQVKLTGAAQMNVQVALGGQVHLCDPTQTLSSTNPYGC
jgi:type IV fimbrial biogenesis protein FimT